MGEMCVRCDVCCELQYYTQCSILSKKEKIDWEKCVSGAMYVVSYSTILNAQYFQVRDNRFGEISVRCDVCCELQYYTQCSILSSQR